MGSRAPAARRHLPAALRSPPPFLHAPLARRCGVCAGACKDKANDCPGWAMSNQCNENPGHTLSQCPNSCQVCTEETGKVCRTPPHRSTARPRTPHARAGYDVPPAKIPNTSLSSPIPRLASRGLRRLPTDVSRPLCAGVQGHQHHRVRCLGHGRPVHAQPRPHEPRLPRHLRRLHPGLRGQERLVQGVGQGRWATTQQNIPGRAPPHLPIPRALSRRRQCDHMNPLSVFRCQASASPTRPR